MGGLPTQLEMLGVFGLVLGRFLFTLGAHIDTCAVLTGSGYDRIYCRLDGSEQCIHPLGPRDGSQLEVVELCLDLSIVGNCLGKRLLRRLGRCGCAFARETGFNGAVGR